MTISPLFLACLQIARPLVEHLTSTMARGDQGFITQESIEDLIHENLVVSKTLVPFAAQLFMNMFTETVGERMVNPSDPEPVAYIIAARMFYAASCNGIEPRSYESANWSP